ncbi:MAG: DUF4388 domain-containing protein [Polyangiaceae bacterium]|nr:DUF4388 domain-containing protein [Myxococcales bacterium]MCB9587057.1 DUF4388 domain-containing protein [Polyangiaceae bacterium]MCB9610131.1 DUF4388 domain-containing protein [Polyangiaceae bacterium]
MHPTGNVRMVERLVAKGLITPEQQEAIIAYHQRMGGRIEEAIIETNAMDEVQLLKFLAAFHKTRFVSTEKLSKADIDRFTLDKVPKSLAEKETIFPVLFDHEKAALSVVMADPDNVAAIQEIKLAASLKDVHAFVARPASVKAAINKAYNGDIHAFAVLDRSAHEQFTTMLNVYERNLVSEESMSLSLADERGRVQMYDERDLKEQRTAGGTGRGGVTSDSYLETLNVLVSLLETSRPDLRGHSAQVARLMKKISERIGLSEQDRAAMVLAGYIHDLGKMSAYHLTALNVAEYEGHRVAAKKLYKAPLRLLEAVELPRETSRAIEQMYERFDGEGLPGGGRGKEISLGARLLAIADTYADLTQNPRNPYRRALRPIQACEVLGRYKEKVFDPNLVDLFRHTVTGDDLKARLLADRHMALVVDPDPEETTVLELRMVEQGFEVKVARTGEQALKMLEKGDVEVVVSELDLAKADGFALLAEARKQEWGRELPWVILTGRSGRADAQRAFELGAADYMTKPVAADLLVAKLKQILERHAGGRGTRGVSGSLIEMSLPDMVQVLWHGRKTGSLKIRAKGETGEIHFVKGDIHNAMWGRLRGEEAFYSMLGLTEGDFVLDPNFVTNSRVINASPEALLLEGMRRLDEGAA